MPDHAHEGECIEPRDMEKQDVFGNPEYPFGISGQVRPEVIARWARSRDGREVLMCSGIDPNERCVKGMMEFVGRGVRTSVALSREESERQNQAKAA